MVQPFQTQTVVLAMFPLPIQIEISNKKISVVLLYLPPPATCTKTTARPRSSPPLPCELQSSNESLGSKSETKLFNKNSLFLSLNFFLY